MMASEAMVETFVRQKVDTVFGIVGSAFMDALDIFPEAGIRFLAGKVLDSDITFFMKWVMKILFSLKKTRLLINLPSGSDLLF